MLFKEFLSFLKFIKNIFYDLFAEARIDEKATQIHAIASLKVLLDATRTSNAVSTTGTTTTTTTTTGGGSDTESQDVSIATVNAGTTATDQIDCGQCSRHDVDNTSESEFHQIDSVVSIKGEKGIVTTHSASQLNHVSNHVSSSNGMESGVSGLSTGNMHLTRS